MEDLLLALWDGEIPKKNQLLLLCRMEEDGATKTLLDHLRHLLHLLLLLLKSPINTSRISKDKRPIPAPTLDSAAAQLHRPLLPPIDGTSSSLNTLLLTFLQPTLNLPPPEVGVPPRLHPHPHQLLLNLKATAGVPLPLLLLPFLPLPKVRLRTWEATATVTAIAAMVVVDLPAPMATV
jgi:hypothetical protein